MGIKQVLSAPRSPWQRAYVERVIGTLRRECLDHLIVFSERCLYRHLTSFIRYYHESRTHLSLTKDAPASRPVQPPGMGHVASVPQVGGLHHPFLPKCVFRHGNQSDSISVHASGDPPSLLRRSVTRRPSLCTTYRAADFRHRYFAR
jgi:hypothetical protein